jgi:anaerobic selenocysteine-containing dehydrogenase
LLVACNNPAVTCPDVGKVRRGLAREDLFTVVHDPFMTATARYADIVLPATTYLETEDLQRAYGTYWMQYSEQAVAPVGKARSNVWLAQALARRMGLDDPVFAMSEREIAAGMLHGSDYDPARVIGGPPLKMPSAAAQRFATPSGRLEIYSEQLAAQGVSPLPDWELDPQEAAEAARWPLRLLTAPGYFQAHTAYAGVDFLRGREGTPHCVLHPDDAASRGLEDGQQVRLHNDRGAIGLILRVSDEVQPGVVLVPGQRPDEEAVSGTVNMLCPDRYTDMGEGATYQSTWLDVAAWA